MIDLEYPSSDGTRPLDAQVVPPLLPTVRLEITEGLEAGFTGGRDEGDDEEWWPELPAGSFT